MATTTVGNGQMSNGADVTTGNTLDVQSGGSANTTTIENGGTETVESGGSDNAATIKAGGAETVSGTENSASVLGTLTINSGGKGNAETIQNGGMETVAAGGADNAAQIAAGGTQTILGAATNETVAGTVNITGATATLGGVTVNSGGAVNLNTSGAAVSNTTVNSGGSLNLNIKTTTATTTTLNQGGLLTINGNAAANGVTLNGGTFELISPKADTGATGSVAFNAGVASKIQFDAAQPTVTAFSPTITGFAAGDVIDEQGLAFAGSSFTTSTSGANTTVTVTGGNNTGSQSFTFQNTAAGSFALASDGVGTTPGLEIVVCFAAGTLIRTADGDVAVEDLAVGDLVVTNAGAFRPIRWLGHRKVDCRTAANRDQVLPIRIAADAFGAGRPQRDLFVSPGHAICVNVLGEVLIPAIALVNGSTVAQVDVDTVTYWHVELDAHDILLAEGLPAESYLAMENRSFFTESDLVALNALPDSPRSHSDFCRPFHADGPIVEAVHARLATCAAAAGWVLAPTVFAGLHLIADGFRIEPSTEGMRARFLVPAGTRDLRLVSDRATPASTIGSADHRRLGVFLAELGIHDGFAAPRVMAVDDPSLSEGFHAPELGRDGLCRWTDGDARLPSTLWTDCGGAFFLRLTLAGPALPRWVAPVAADDSQKLPVRAA